jgi:hypothetical protein
MKLRISIILLGASLLLNSGCASTKTAYNGEEHSRFANPGKTAETNNQSLAAVGEGPVTQSTHSANPGGTGEGAMTGTSEPDTWGGALSVY